MIDKEPTQNQSSLPCVVQVGFAGPRILFENAPSGLKEQYQNEIRVHLVECLDGLSQKLGLNDNHFICGISQVAIGADTLFAEALAGRGDLHRVFLPNSQEEYLGAIGSQGPDFNESQKALSTQLLDSTNVAQVQAIPDSGSRHDRFRQVNAAICGASDFMIFLVENSAKNGLPGGTGEMVKRSSNEGKSYLLISYEETDDRIRFEDKWHLVEEQIIPSLPVELQHLNLPKLGETVPSIQEYCEPLKAMASEKSKSQRRFFQYASALVLLTHILATFFATFVLSYPKYASKPNVTVIAVGQDAANNPKDNKSSTFEAGYAAKLVTKALFLLAELILLCAGWWWHRTLHHSHTARNWATARVVAELARSIKTIQPKHIQLDYLFGLSLPFRFRFLLRTLNVLHLNSTRSANAEWNQIRDQYLGERVKDQIKFYQSAIEKDKRRLASLNNLFVFCTILAILATGTKLVLLLAAPQIPLGRLLGIFAVLLPVLAVGGLSWANALDYQARIETFEEMLRFLRRQKQILPLADTNEEFEKLIQATEAELLGEVANWFSRRANINIA